MSRSSPVGIAATLVTLTLACSAPDGSLYGPPDQATAVFSSGPGDSTIYVAVNPAGLSPDTEEVASLKSAVAVWQEVFHNNNGIPQLEFTTNSEMAQITIAFQDTGSQYWCGSAAIDVWAWNAALENECGDYSRDRPHDLQQTIVHEICENTGLESEKSSNDVIAAMCPCVDREPIGNQYVPTTPCEWEKQQALADYQVRDSVAWESFLVTNVQLTAATEQGSPGDTVELVVVASRTTYAIGEEGPEGTDQETNHGVQWSMQGDATWVMISDSIARLELGDSGTVQVTAKAEPAADVIFPWPEDTEIITIVESSVDRVEITPSSLLLTDDNWQTLYKDLTAQAYDAADNSIPGLYYTWSNSNPAAARLVGTFGQTVSVEGVRSGFATITVQVDGKSDQAPVRVRCGTRSDPECQQF